MLLILALLQTGVPLPPLPRRWAQFSRAGALNHITETVEIATGDRGASNDFPYRLRLIKQSTEGTEVWMAHSENCPVILDVVQSIKGIKMPTFAPYGIPGQLTTSMFDGTGYSLSAPTSDISGEVTVSSNVRSSIAIWIDASFNKLAPCWRKAHF
jgi:hypothetical protein